MNVTLEYLQKLRIFTKHLINDLLCHQNRISLELDLNTYIYDSKLLLWIGNKNDKIRVDLVNADYSELSAVSTVHMYAVNDIQKYKDLDINLDFFSLSTVLNDDELVELYVLKNIESFLDLLSDHKNSVIINVSLLQRYYSTYANY